MKKLQPNYANLHEWESYPVQLPVEYVQSMEEGLDVEQYKPLFDAIAKMPAGEHREKMADVLFDLVLNAPLREGYPFDEPSDLKGIRALRKPHPVSGEVPGEEALFDKLYGAWLGRVVGCLLGKPIEGIHTDELHPILKETGNWPMHRYINASEITREMIERCRFDLAGRCFADTVDGMPFDDDTNYLILAQEVVEKYGRDFTPFDMSRAWLDMQPKLAYCTAERVAFCNFVKGYEPPQSAVYKNPYREWIGAQIRADYFGYINPGNPELAAEMAFRDASISHIKNGIYGEMFVAAMLACAAVTDSIEDIILGGLAEIPATSRLYKETVELLDGYHSGVSQQECFSKIHSRYNEKSTHDWCHTVSNALIVVASLLYGEGDFTKSVCMSVETGFDTDCNGATVGSIVGMCKGASCVGPEWTAPLNDALDTTIFGVGRVKISERAKMTMKHLPR